MSRRSESRERYTKAWNSLSFAARREAVLQSVGGSKSADAPSGYRDAVPVNLAVWTSEDSIEAEDFPQEEND